jgi:hypothetical protein
MMPKWSALSEDQLSPLSIAGLMVSSRRSGISGDDRDQGMVLAGWAKPGVGDG